MLNFVKAVIGALAGNSGKQNTNEASSSGNEVNIYVPQGASPPVVTILSIELFWINFLAIALVVIAVTLFVQHQFGLGPFRNGGYAVPRFLGGDRAKDRIILLPDENVGDKARVDEGLRRRK